MNFVTKDRQQEVIVTLNESSFMDQTISLKEVIIGEGISNIIQGRERGRGFVGREAGGRGGGRGVGGNAWFGSARALDPDVLPKDYAMDLI